MFCLITEILSRKIVYVDADNRTKHFYKGEVWLYTCLLKSLYFDSDLEQHNLKRAADHVDDY